MFHKPRFRLAAVLFFAAVFPIALTGGLDAEEPGTEPASQPADRAYAPSCIPAPLQVTDFLDLPSSPEALGKGVRIARVRVDVQGSTGEDQFLRLQRRDQSIVATLVDLHGKETPLEAESFVAIASEGCKSGSGCVGDQSGAACCVWACSPGSPDAGFEPWLVMTCVSG